MVAIGETWKFAGAQVDFTIVGIDEEYAYYTMNWDEHVRKFMRYSFDYVYEYDGFGNARAVRVHNDPEKVCMVRLPSFDDGTVVRTN
ncbi:hypothetical protein PP459_gp045 [Streptomyces phage Wakanda]|uniref:Uncharacterized protein n=2 Tax=Wakandavirus TaxID=3044854 RepID=A0A6G8R3H1_9CAUD|nr:hypothetical protein PP459_gp045 [Streptomyces phage Wakanda]YP_010652511.1 hypothetical protein PP460_gp047 [Streptomyces phage Muntaha]QIN94188.1 hypothetical protein SEA_WAKANDA_228 [Streptomyces phage Wakanda]QIN94755.1 hypothetical protein SEA_MUNTAHA_232 [Streptomyces phage Muntaha]